jgi:hypothetical protein
VTTEEKTTCPHDAEQADFSTYGDLGRAIRQVFCAGCGEIREEPYDWYAHFGLPRPEGARP